VLHSVEDVVDPTVTLVFHFPQSHRHACFATRTNWERNDFIRERFQGMIFWCNSNFIISNSLESELGKTLLRVIELASK
jgi:hypothetical protein